MMRQPANDLLAAAEEQFGRLTEDLTAVLGRRFHSRRNTYRPPEKHTLSGERKMHLRPEDKAMGKTQTKKMASEQTRRPFMKKKTDYYASPLFS